MPVVFGLAPPSNGVDLIRPPMLTSCLCGEPGRLPWLLGLAILLLFSSVIQSGWDGWCLDCGFGWGFGDSGLLRALSNQLDLVGLHRLESIVLEGLVGSLPSALSRF